MINLHQAFDNLCVGVKVFDGLIKLPKLKPVEANIHREIAGIVKSITVSMSKIGKFYTSILMDDGVEASVLLHTVKKVTGVDLGLYHFAIESNDGKITNPRFVKRAEKNLRREQLQPSRKEKGRTNRANARADFQHKLSRTFVDENQAVIV